MGENEYSNKLHEHLAMRRELFMKLWESRYDFAYLPSKQKFRFFVGKEGVEEFTFTEMVMFKAFPHFGITELD